MGYSLNLHHPVCRYSFLAKDSVGLLEGTKRVEYGRVVGLRAVGADRHFDRCKARCRACVKGIKMEENFALLRTGEGLIFRDLSKWNVWIEETGLEATLYIDPLDLQSQNFESWNEFQCCKLYCKTVYLLDASRENASQHIQGARALPGIQKNSKIVPLISGNVCRSSEIDTRKASRL